MPGSIVIRLLTPTDADAYLRVRLSQVELEPNAFAESPIEVRGKTSAATAERLAAPRDVSFIVGACADSEIVATAGYFRRMELKTRHKGRVWGVFVAPVFRGQGLGRLVMNKRIAEGLVEMYASLYNGLLAEDYYRNKPTVMGKVKLADFAKEFAVQLKFQ